MKALITGGAGFIGSHLAERLLQDSVEVTVIDNLSTGSLENLAGIKSAADFEFVKGDICDIANLEPLVKNCDVVYHLAAAVGVKLIADNPVRTIETNISGTEAVLNLANKYRKKTLIASSSEVYGKNEAVPFREDADIVLGSTSLSRWSYACSKAVDEFLGLAFYNQYGLEVIVARFFNTIGPKQTGQYGMVVPRFIRWALNNEPVLIYGDGRQRRCFCYIHDLIDAIVKLMNCKDAAGGVFNIGSTEEISIEQLADRIIKITQSKSEKRFVPYQQAYGRPIEDMMRRVPNLERIKKLIGWAPKTRLDKSIEIIVKSLKSA